MSKRVINFGIVFFALLLSVQANAQCAMCRASLESSDGGIKPEAVNDGIVYLMIFPYLLVGLVGYAVYRLRKKKTTNTTE
ncbi:hypothetical protein FUA48_06305 [Flavobacterium alkalisoli]|uniref:Uncharacterized protein n=1 Tax=Flavobacterium alkalisoli TaxID=2602769 RepID=A0A5B9FPH2_9FLAO|nr:hypothetical protein [Flavobacterium alkalisoli]QEE49203.1 hypothetical protein FUA48_06305 [Flavobacterium alkalisoli]